MRVSWDATRCDQLKIDRRFEQVRFFHFFTVECRGSISTRSDAELGLTDTGEKLFDSD
jgi:hypothetical protein